LLWYGPTRSQWYPGPTPYVPYDGRSPTGPVIIGCNSAGSLIVGAGQLVGMRGVSDDDATRTARRVRAAGWLLGSCCLLAVFLALTAPAAAAGTSVANVSEASGGSLLPASVAGVLGGLPNPLAL